MLELTETQTAGGMATPMTPAWTRKDLLDTDTLSAAEIELVMETATAMHEIRSRPVGKVATLRGTTVVTLFYEQSTRTRASFEVAAKAMGADVVNLSATGSSVEKGESLIDTVRTLEAIGADVVVMRHGRSGAPYLAARNTRASIINRRCDESEAVVQVLVACQQNIGVRHLDQVHQITKTTGAFS